MTPTEIKAALAKIGSTANKHLGQHFLIDQQVLVEIIEAAEIKKGDRVLEIGPGLGVLTRELIKHGANVVAIEKDRRLAEYIFNSFPSFDGEKEPALSERKLVRVERVPPQYDKLRGRIEGLVADAAKLDWDQFVGDKPWKFVSNLPYAITSLALRKALYAKKPPEVVVVLVQREVAERVLARDGKMSLLSLMVRLAVGPVVDPVETSRGTSLQINKNIQIIRRVPAGAFYPPPKVESAILKIIPALHDTRYTKWGIEPEEVMKVAKQGFAHPRKLVQRNLGIENSKWQELSSQIGFEIKARAEDLTAKQWAELAKLTQ